MKKTNIILGIVIAIFIICAVTILVTAIINNKEKETVPVNVDFTALSSNIEEITNMDNTKMQQISIEELQSEFNISPEWIKQVIGVKPYVNVSSSMYVIVEVTDGNTNNVINAFKEYGNKYDEMWKDYLAEEYEIVKNRQIGSKGNYVYFIVSDYSKDIIDLIK
ncbi:MAG: DUF4358 domain-containing protein [Clostridia bacterium]